MDRASQLEELFNDSQTVKRLSKQYFHKVLGVAELSQAQMGIIFFLSEHQPLSGKQIAAKFQISPSAVTQLIDGLEKLGFIKREQDEHDRRVQYLSLSYKGLAKMRELQDSRRQFFMEITESMSDTELQTMMSMQKKMILQIETKLGGNA